MWQIGDVEIKNPIVIAPMAGISNMAFRTICYRFNAGLVYTEMISDKALQFNSKKTIDMTKSDEIEHPLTMQLFGHDIDSMVKGAQFLDNNTSCDIIDINMGCPVNKVIKAQAGSYLMQDIDYATKLVKAIVDNVKKPVTVKMRSGFNLDSINCIELAQSLEKVGVKAITLHPRTRYQLYEGKADWSLIKKMKEALSIPVIGNGDIKSVDDAINMIESTGCDAVMIGRGALGNPFLIKQLDEYFKGEPISNPTYHEKMAMGLEHARNLIALHGEHIGIHQMRGLASWYIIGLPFSARVKNACSSIETYNDLEKIFNDYEKFLDTNIEE